jgi:hypothetical protein
MPKAFKNCQVFLTTAFGDGNIDLWRNLSKLEVFQGVIHSEERT